MLKTILALTFMMAACAAAGAPPLRGAAEDRELLSDDAEALMDMLLHIHDGDDDNQALAQCQAQLGAYESSMDMDHRIHSAIQCALGREATPTESAVVAGLDANEQSLLASAVGFDVESGSCLTGGAKRRLQKRAAGGSKKVFKRALGGKGDKGAKVTNQNRWTAAGMMECDRQGKTWFENDCHTEEELQQMECDRQGKTWFENDCHTEEELQQICRAKGSYGDKRYYNGACRTELEVFPLGEFPLEFWMKHKNDITPGMVCKAKGERYYFVYDNSGSGSGECIHVRHRDCREKGNTIGVRDGHEICEGILPGGFCGKYEFDVWNHFNYECRFGGCELDETGTSGTCAFGRECKTVSDCLSRPHVRGTRRYTKCTPEGKCGWD